MTVLPGEKEKNNHLGEKPEQKPSFKGQLGGARPGAGRPKGKLNEQNERVKQMRELTKKFIMDNLEPMLRSQLQLANGISYVYKIVKTYDKKQKVTKVEHVLVEDPWEIKAFLDEHEGGNGPVEGEDYYYITTKAPDNRALDSLIDRLFGKARQNIGLDGGEDGKPMQARVILDRLAGVLDEQDDDE